MIAFAILAMLCVAMAVISCVPEAASSYTSLPMLTTWGALCIAAIIYMCRRKLWHRPAVAMLHMSFIIILAGALITHLYGTERSLHLRIGQSAQVGEYNVTLLDFIVDCYPGTPAPRDFISTIAIESDTGIVSMNNVYKTRGYRFYQQAYDPDGLGTVLTVTNDPAGIAITYIGYAMLLIAMLWITFRKHLFMHRRRVMIFSIMTLCAISSWGTPATVPQPVAEKLSNLYIYNGNRIVPFSAFARDFAIKITGSDSYQGLTAEQILAGWLFYYDSWKEEPCIKLRKDNSQRVLGGKNVSLASFFNTDGTYVANGSEHVAANEQFALISAAATGSLWKIFPVIDSDNHLSWLSPVDDQPNDVALDQWHFSRHCINYIAELLMTARYSEACEAINKIGSYQHTLAGSAIPSPTRTWCEVKFSSLASSIIPAIALLCSGLILFFYPMPVISLAISCMAALWLTFLIGLNWIASGNVPMANGYETMQWMALAASLTGVCAWMRGINQLSPLCCIVASLAMMVAMMGHRNPQITAVVPVLRSPLLSVHVLTVMLAYAALAIIALCGIAWLMGRKELITTGRQLLCPAVFLLCAGIFIGAVWANQSWGRYWGWDPKEVWALITMLVYSAALHRSTLRCFKSDRFFAIFSIVAFLTVIMTYFGVNFILGGLHGYA
ncbi:MAG: cytochrome c biogenesis protein CcsA [Odoribacter sp.]|nr:cytochrome c biogenesis protein CcsA [Odoribacter sp.]